MIPGNLISTLFAPSGASSPVGQQAFTSVGSTNFTVPAGVTSVCMVTIGAGSGGGGALSFINNVAVTPGETLTVVVPGYNTGTACTIKRGGTTLCGAASASGVTGGQLSAGTGSNRYSGGNAGATFAYEGEYEGDITSNYESGGGGGTAGYNANGGAGTNSTGRWAYDARVGGGVGLKGGAAGGTGGMGSTGAVTSAGVPNSGGVGVTYGAGGTAIKYEFEETTYPPPYGTRNDVAFGVGGTGGARIIWGSGRMYPDTNTADL